MSVTLQTFNKTGRTCPKCDNNSIFIEDVRSCSGFFIFPGKYKYTLEKCEMGSQYCDYISKIHKETGEVLETTFPDNPDFYFKEIENE